MLPPAHRLRDADAFRSAVRSGARAGSGSMVLHLLLPDAVSDEPAPVRVGLVVSRAVGIAVVRNRVKRRLRHLCRGVVAGLPAGSVLVVRALPAAAAADHGRLEADLARCLRRLAPAVTR